MQNIIVAITTKDGVLKGMKAQLIQRKAAIRGIEVSFNTFCQWLQTSKHLENERMQAGNNLRHENT